MTINQLYEQIDRELLDRWVSEARQEDLHLDFKTIISGNDLGRDDRKNLAKAISGFANSDGGIIVWGVECKKDQATGINAASVLKPMQNARAILSTLQSLTGEATNPTADGVVHRLVLNDTGNNLAGFIVTLVPESDRGPHMAKLGEDRYYKRSGDSFYRMEHFDIEDMFGGRQKPLLTLNLIPVQRDDSQEELRFGILNVGRAVAKHAGFLANFKNLEIISVSDNMQNDSNLNSGRPVVSWSNVVGVIHPHGIRMHAGSMRFRRVDLTKSVFGEISVYCENARPQTVEIEVPVGPPGREGKQTASSS